MTSTPSGFNPRALLATSPCAPCMFTKTILLLIRTSHVYYVSYVAGVITHITHLSLSPSSPGVSVQDLWRAASVENKLSHQHSERVLFKVAFIRVGVNINSPLDSVVWVSGINSLNVSDPALQAQYKTWTGFSHTRARASTHTHISTRTHREPSHLSIHLMFILLISLSHALSPLTICFTGLQSLRNCAIIKAIVKSHPLYGANRFSAFSFSP